LRESDAIQQYLAELRAWAPRTNLVGSIAPEALSRHVLDSLAAREHLSSGARVVDLGSGAGFPGIPLAIARPDLDLVLVEIRERRVHFLRHVVRRLGLRCRIERRRIEELPDEPFDFALLRAVAKPPVALAMATGWVHSDGEIWIWSGGSDRDGLPPALGGLALPSGGEILRIRRPR
jgi:16S rRNA (guanine527-N7)-methyltransferase